MKLDAVSSPPPATGPRHPSRIFSADEHRILEELQGRMSECGLPGGKFGYVLRDDPTQQAKAIIDVAWPTGLPEGRGRPVALLLNESAETYRTVNQAGFDCYTTVESFKEYVEDEIVGEVATAVE